MAAKAKSRHRAERLALREGALRIAIVSDTHGNPHPASVELVAKERPDAILHGGDIGAPECLDRFAEIAPVIAVRGNIDEVGLPDSIDLALCEDDAVRMRIFLIHQAVYGARLRADVARLAEKHGADLVVCGHSHVPFLAKERGLIVFNPGSIGPRRFHLPITFGVMRIEEGRTSLFHVSCETGERWLPG